MMQIIYFFILTLALFSMFSDMCCVAAEVIAVDGHLVRYDNGVVYDTESTLEWYAGPDEGVRWEDASKWVAGLDASRGKWRMPTKKELGTLHQVGDGVNNITYLLPTSGYWFWCGSTKKSSCRWVFSFSYGGEGWAGQAPADGGRAIAVRYRKYY